jgi:hypothetical protein
MPPSPRSGYEQSKSRYKITIFIKLQMSYSPSKAPSSLTAILTDEERVSVYDNKYTKKQVMSPNYVQAFPLIQNLTYPARSMSLCA